MPRSLETASVTAVLPHGMFCSRKQKLKLEKNNKQTLRAVFSQDEKNYRDLLADHYKVSICQKHFQILATVVYIGQINLIHNLSGAFPRTMEIHTIYGKEE